MNKYLLHGKLDAREGDGDNLASILLEASRLVSTAKGCISYIISRDSADSNAVWITEVWESRQHHDDSLKVEGVRELISRAMPLLAGTPQKGQELMIMGGTGI